MELNLKLYKEGNFVNFVTLIINFLRLVFAHLITVPRDPVAVQFCASLGDRTSPVGRRTSVDPLSMLLDDGEASLRRHLCQNSVDPLTF